MENKEKKWLSASGIEVLEKCSWKYKCQSLDRVPQKPNVGSTRGTIAHAIFEILVNKRHRKHVDKILAHESVGSSLAVYKLLVKMMKSREIYDELNYDIMDAMILVGLKNDFYGEERKGQISKPEYKFELENSDPEYSIHGYIDAYIKYPDNSILIKDFKSSKAKFAAEDLKSNNQAMVYSLIGYKQLEAKEVKVEFLFLRFPRQPIQEVKPTKEQLAGFEYYLSYLYGIIENFDDKMAQSNFAATSRENSWLCQRGSWKCPYLEPFDYWALLDEKGVVARTSVDKASLKAKEGQTMAKLSYSGCPYWNKKKESTDDEM